jgi:DNA-binding response OmpR family regulator
MSKTAVAESILVVEDEKDVRDLLAENLRREGYQVGTARSGRDALSAVRRKRPDLVLLDLMLPDLDGIEVCKQLKYNAETRGIPVVILTAKVEESDVVLGLGVGAEDYIEKPFRMRELIARVKTALRRVNPLIDAKPVRRAEFGPISVDLERHEALVSGKTIKTTPTELKVLHLLVSQPGIVHSRDEIIAECSPGDGKVKEHLVDVYIQLLRRKLGPHRGYIQTIRGVGYRLAAP